MRRRRGEEEEASLPIQSSDDEDVEGGVVAVVADIFFSCIQVHIVTVSKVRGSTRSKGVESNVNKGMTEQKWKVFTLQLDALVLFASFANKKVRLIFADF